MASVTQMQQSTRHSDATPTPIDSETLAAQLRLRIEGEVRFEDGDRALYVTE
jgi:hypothetical protein